MKVRDLLVKYKTDKINHYIVAIDGTSYFDAFATNYDDPDVAKLVIIDRHYMGSGAVNVPIGLVQVNLPYDKIKEVICLKIEDNLKNAVPPEVLAKFEKSQFYEDRDGKGYNRLHPTNN